MGGRKALVVATYEYADGGLRRLAAPEHDAESLAAVLADPAIAGFDVTMLVNQPHHVVGEAIADFYGGARRDDLTLLYFTGHGLKDDEGRFHLAMTNTRRSALSFTAISGAQLNDAMDDSPSRRKVLILDCCYSGAFPAGRTAKADEGVQTLERFQGKGRAVLTASDATQYAFEGDDLRGTGTSSVFTRHLVQAIRTGSADLDEDGDITLDELYSYVRDRVVAEMPQQRPKKQEDVDGRILIARNVRWTLPAHLRHAIESPIAAQRLSAVEGLGHLFRTGNDMVRAAVTDRLTALAEDDSKAVCAAATDLLNRLGPAPAERERHEERPRARAEAAQREASAAPERERREAAELERSQALERRRREAAERAHDDGAEEREQEDPRRDGVAASAVHLSTGARVVALLLLAGAGAAAVGSGSLDFEATNGYLAGDIGWGTVSWLVVLVPVLVAAVVLLRARSPSVFAIAGGLVAGGAWSLVHQVLLTAVLYGYVGWTAGPGIFSAAVGAVLLAGAAAVLVRGRSPSRRPLIQRHWPALLAAAAQLVLLVVWSGLAPDGVPMALSLVTVGMLAAVCLPLALLAFTPFQRSFGLAAAAAFGVWLLAVQDGALVIGHDGPVDGVATGLACTAGIVAAAFSAQLGRHPSRAADPVTSRARR